MQLQVASVSSILWASLVFAAWAMDSWLDFDNSPISGRACLPDDAIVGVSKTERR